MLGKRLTSKRLRISRSCRPIPVLIDSMGSSSVALYGRSRRGLPLVSSTHSSVPVRALDDACIACVVVFPSIATEDCPVTRYTGMDAQPTPASIAISRAASGCSSAGCGQRDAENLRSGWLRLAADRLLGRGYRLVRAGVAADDCAP